MKENNYPKGSEWRKWDLHVHTKADANYKYSSDTNISSKEQNDDEYPKIFITHLYSIANLGVIALTDHNSANWIDRIIQANENHNPGNGREKITILPGVEIETGDGIHLLVIFNPDSQLEDVKTNFRKASWKETIEHFLTSIRNIENSSANKTTEEILKEAEKWDAICIFAHVTNDKGFFRISSGDRKTKIYKHTLTKIFQIPNEGISNNGYLNIIEGKNPDYGNKSITKITASDAKSLKDIAINNCWIKADPTFEGLKQIIYEPEERVRIQKNNPQNDYPKHYFSKIIIKETNIFDDSKVKFEQNEIELNPNLITIIGGRGTGKSLLLDAIAKTLKKVDGNVRSASISIKKDDFSITYTKSDNTNEEYNIQEENIVDYLHIHQGFVKAIVDPKHSSGLDKEIKELLNLNEKPQIAYEESFLSRLIDEIFEIKDFLNKVDESGEKINSKEYIEKQQKQKKTLIENITTKENKELISKYTNNITTINNLSKKIQQLEDLKRDLEQFQSDKNNLIKEINQFVGDKNKIPEISFDEQIQKIDSLNEYYKNEKENKEVENQNITAKFKNEGISGDITTLLEQTKKYQEEIDALENKKKLVEDKEKDLKEKFDKIKEVIDEICKSYKNFEEDIKNKWSNLKKGKEDWTKNQKELVNELLKDIDIEVIERFGEDKFYEKIQETLNLSKFRETTNKARNERIKEFFNINSKEDFILFLKNEKKILSNEEEMNLSEFINSEYLVKDGAKDFLRLILLNYSDFWQVITKPKYKNKELSQLSVGMKGTMYLCLKLATDPFMKPFIFDQPEDDLDNNFIVNELVPIFRTIKKYRQVIIVTHNANLVVNADAEQVIVAENENESINYITGSLENINIRNKVCEILEGGKDAFRKRERKYNIKI